MTRITNLGLKRTYVEAGFGGVDTDEHQGTEAAASKPQGEATTLSKKPRKRRKKTKATAGGEGVTPGDARTDVTRDNQATTNIAKDPGKDKRKDKNAKAVASQRRRLKRAAERHASTTCLSCRKTGHTVKDCPEARTALHEDDTGNPGTPGKSTVGVCYRCGSRRHNLSRCKKPVNPANPLPFASCFVCSGKGHLVSSCPQNQGKGIYPNGGSCKLCGQTSHLAKDCELQKQEHASKSALMLGGTRTEGGADEDDFHVLKRRRDAVQREEAILQKLGDKPVGLVAKPKPKVVVFR